MHFNAPRIAKAAVVGNLCRSCRIKTETDNVKFNLAATNGTFQRNFVLIIEGRGTAKLCQLLAMQFVGLVNCSGEQLSDW